MQKFKIVYMDGYDEVRVLETQEVLFSTKLPEHIPDRITIDESVLDKVVEIWNSSGKLYLIDEYLLHDRRCTQEEREIIIESIYEFKRKKMKKKKELIDHMFNSACGYGMAEGNGAQSKFDSSGNYLPNKRGGTKEGGRRAFHRCMNSIPDEYFDDFIYTLYRIADKSGHEGFEI